MLCCLDVGFNCSYFQAPLCRQDLHRGRLCLQA